MSIKPNDYIEGSGPWLIAQIVESLDSRPPGSWIEGVCWLWCNEETDEDNPIQMRVRKIGEDQYRISTAPTKLGGSA